MYESYYGLRTHPFSLAPDPRFLYLGRKHKLALSLLEYGMLNRSAFTVITGEPGTGKTTLLNTILDRSERELTIGVLSHTHGGLGSLLPWVLMTFGLESKGMDNVELYRAFAGFLAQEHARRRRVVLIVDEAQNLGPAMLEELRLLSNLNDGNRQPLQIILSGQPGLRALLQRGELLQFAQRISVDYHLDPFGEEETPEYIRHRISVAGGPVTLMTDLACRVVHRLTVGNPRLINQVCDVALAYGYAAKTPWITARTVHKAALDRSANGILPLNQGEPWSMPADQELEEERRQLDGLTKPKPAEPAAQKNAASSQPSPQASYNRGVAFKEAGAFKQAITFFEQAGRDPDLAVRARTQIALCLRASGRTADAIGVLQELCKQDKGAEEERRQARYFLARTLEASGQTEDAAAHYRTLRDEHSEYRDVRARLGRLSGLKRSSLATGAAGGLLSRLLPRSLTHLLRSAL